MPDTPGECLAAPPTPGDASEVWAAAYVALGLALTPTRAKAPYRPDWQRASVAPDHWATSPIDGIGCIHALSGTCCLDIDDVGASRVAQAAVGVDLDALLATGCASVGAPERAKRWFRRPEGLASLPTHRLAWLAADGGEHVVCELRCAGGQDVLPPSAHPSGGRYRWLDGRDPWTMRRFPPLPASLADLWARWDELLPAMRAADPRAAEMREAQRRAPAGSEGWDGVRAEILRRYPLRRVLADIGATAGRGRRWHCPIHPPDDDTSAWTWAPDGGGPEVFLCAHGGVDGYGVRVSVGVMLDAIALSAWARRETMGAATVRLARELGIPLPRPEVNTAHPPATGDTTAPAPMPEPVTAAVLVSRHPDLRDPVIHGLLRRGETANLIAAPKVGKSWIVHDLALSVATGNPWLGCAVALGAVLVIDNELHPETLAHRLRRVADAREVDLAAVGDRVQVLALRGALRDLPSLGEWLTAHAAGGRYILTIVDAWYRALPTDTDENANGEMARLYDRLDAVAAVTESAYVLIHHASKGDQSSKSVTDVGSGAGAMSRATDTHIILRRHSEEGCAVMEAAVRSWQPVAPRVVRWTYPTWALAPDLDPADLWSPARRQRARAEEPATRPARMTPGEFAARYVTAPISRARLETQAQDAMPLVQIHRLLTVTMEEGLIHRTEVGGRPGYAPGPQPELPTPPPEPERASSSPSKRARVEEAVREHPDWTAADIARAAGASAEWVRRILRGRNTTTTTSCESPPHTPPARGRRAGARGSPARGARVSAPDRERESAGGDA